MIHYETPLRRLNSKLADVRSYQCARFRRPARFMPSSLASKPPSDLDDSADQVLVREPGLCRSRSEARIRSKKRVWVYVDNERLAGRIDAKVEAGIAAQPE